MEWGNFAQVVSAMVAALALAVAIVGPRSRASADAHRALAEKVSGHDAELAAIRRDIEHLPDVDATHRQELMIAEIKGKMDVLTERLKPVQDISSRLQEFLLEQAKAK